MSYILDALKRAESERSRGAVPNIHVHPATAAGSPDSRPAALRVGLGVILLLIALAIVWAWWAGSGPAESPSPASEKIAASPDPTPAPIVAPVVLRPPPSAVQPVPMPASIPKPPPPPAEPSIVPTRNPQGRAGVAAVTSLPASQRPRRSEAMPSASGVAAAPASLPGSDPRVTLSGAGAGEERVYPLKELPDDIRNSLPVLVVGGATYSESASSRMLIVNGSLFHEGDKLTAEVTLQQIQLRSAVLSYRGYRYLINY